MNKTVNGKQCTIARHADDLKTSHKEEKVAESIVAALNEKHGQEAELTVTRGKVHEHLGMTIDCSEPGVVQFKMFDCIDEALKETPEDLPKNAAATPAASHLFNTNDAAPKIDEQSATLCHHATAKMLHLCKRARPDLQTAMSFLATRVREPDVDDCKKLG